MLKAPINRLNRLMFAMIKIGQTGESKGGVLFEVAGFADGQPSTCTCF
jgi:hypothetical protein